MKVDGFECPTYGPGAADFLMQIKGADENAVSSGA
jgi:hypothetical protein